MQDINDLDLLNKYDDNINLEKIFKAVIGAKWIIISMTTFSAFFGIAYSLSLPNIYESKALLTPTSSDMNSSLMQNYGSIANLAGINIPSGSADSNQIQAIEKLNSLSFFKSSFLPNIFLPNLMAFEYWDSSKNLNEYDDKIYNSTLNSWVIDPKNPGKLMPSPQDSYRLFRQENVSITKDKTTNFLTIKIKHQSPYIAKQWTEILVREINSFYREKDKSEAERAVNYLNSIISETNFSEIKQVIASLLQQETQKLTLIKAKEFYVFEYIDYPVVMERKTGPNRALICVLATLLGFAFSIFGVLIRSKIF